MDSPSRDRRRNSLPPSHSTRAWRWSRRQRRHWRDSGLLAHPVAVTTVTSRISKLSNVADASNAVFQPNPCIVACGMKFEVAATICTAIPPAGQLTARRAHFEPVCGTARNRRQLRRRGQQGKHAALTCVQVNRTVVEHQQRVVVRVDEPEHQRRHLIRTRADVVVHAHPNIRGAAREHGLHVTTARRDPHPAAAESRSSGCTVDLPRRSLLVHVRNMRRQRASAGEGIQRHQISRRHSGREGPHRSDVRSTTVPRRDLPEVRGADRHHR